MSKTLRDYITDSCYLELVESSTKLSNRDMECAKSWLPTFKERFPDINWTLNISQKVTITDGEFHFIVGKGGCLYVIMFNGIVKAGHVFGMGAKWAAKLFDNPYFVGDDDVEWSDFFTYPKSYLDDMYQRELEKDQLFKMEYAAATLALWEIEKFHPTAQLVIQRGHHDPFPEITRHIIIAIRSGGDFGWTHDYMKDIDGTWYRGECFDGYQEWKPVNIQTLEIDHSLRDGSPRWIR